MSRFNVLNTVAALAIGGCMATAQTPVINLFQSINKVIPDGQATGVNDIETLHFTDPLFASITNVQVALTSANGFNGAAVTALWAPDDRNVDPQTVLDTGTQTALLSSVNGMDTNGAWTLFLADLDFGRQGSLAQWGAIVSAIPEPSTLALVGLAGFALGVRFLRRRNSRQKPV
jgi:putative intracellular protease/amidase